MRAWIWLACCVIVYASVLVSPAIFWPAAFLALGIPLALIANVGLAFWALIKMRGVWLGVAGVGLWLGYPFIPATVQLPFFKSEPQVEGSHPPQLKVLSYNLGNMYGGSGRLEVRKANALGIMRFTLGQGANVLCLQEVFNYPLISEYTPLRKLRRAGYIYKMYSHYLKQGDTLGPGMGIWARRPLRHGKVCYHRPLSNNQIVRADYGVARGDTVRIFSCHLQSIKLTYEDMAVRRAPARAWGNIRRTIFKMRRAYKIRAEQVAVLCREIEASPHPVIVCGDMNDTPYSYTYWQLRRRLGSTFEARGTGIGATYNGKFRGGLRIDHQFYSKENIVPIFFKTYKRVDYSDHLPILGEYNLVNNDLVNNE